MSAGQPVELARRPLFEGIVINNRSGEPGHDGSSFTVRGLATTGNNDVLIVVDGVPGQIGGLERLNPNDIESIFVLKDASAAIYGSRTANGVILITIKRGKSGKPVINLSFNQRFSSPTRLPDMADAPTYATIANEIAYNNRAGGLNQQYSAEEIQKFGNGSDPISYPNTDWTKESVEEYGPAKPGQRFHYRRFGERALLPFGRHVVPGWSLQRWCYQIQTIQLPLQHRRQRNERFQGEPVFLRS